jgi:hypothetical protein
VQNCPVDLVGAECPIEFFGETATAVPYHRQTEAPPRSEQAGQSMTKKASDFDFHFSL